MTLRRSTHDAIRLRGVRHNNLKNFDLDIPIGKLTVITGLSGSGKSSLAFDTLFAEGQRRYIETFSPYARQFFDRMDKPQVDRIEGIPPAIAIEQRNAVRSTRSTVGTMTEICDYMKVVWPHLAELNCRQCGRLVRTEPPQIVWEKIHDDGQDPGTAKECLITFDLPLSEKLSLADSLGLISRQGYQRLLLGNEIVRLEEALERLQGNAQTKDLPVLRLTVIQDRLTGAAANRARFMEACEQAYHFGKGRLTVHIIKRDTSKGPGSDAEPTRSEGRKPELHAIPFSRGFHCASCDLDYPEPTPSLFSFNHPVGACPDCKGFGRIISIDYGLAIPDRSKTLEGGCVKPWQTGMSAECQSDLSKACHKRKVPMDVPFDELSEEHQTWVVQGDSGYDSEDSENSWPQKWYGVKGYFRWLESKSYKMHVRVLLSRYRAYTTCESCSGKRLKPDALLFGISRHGTAKPERITLPEFYAMPCEQALAFVEQMVQKRSQRPANDPLALALSEVRARLRYLVDVGLGYLTLDRPTRTLSGGETERVNLTTCLGTRLVNTLFVLDEPSVGLHARDTARLVRILQQLRDAGNTVTVVEHDASVIRAADQIVDLGPGQGEKGGQLVFVGSVPSLLNSDDSLTGQYLSKRRQIELPVRRPVPTHSTTAGTLSESASRYRTERDNATKAAVPFLTIANASRHNLKKLNIQIPLRRLVALTGVSGSGKTTLVREVLLPALQARLNRGGGANALVKASDRMGSNGDEESLSLAGDASVRLEGWESLNQVVIVDQSPLGKTPRSNPMVYIGAFDDVRDLFAQTSEARQRGLGGSAFSFNSGVGQCARCRGAGFEKIEMQFLSDVFIRCPECNGRRYRAHILEIKLPSGSQRWSIADMLEATVDDALIFLANFIHLPAGRRALARLKLLQDVGLGYLRLGQPINTLSGGESQRLKLVSHLAETAAAQPATEGGQLATKNSRAEVSAWLAERSKGTSNRSSSGRKRTPPNRELQSEDDETSVEIQKRGTLFLFDEPTTGLHFDDVRVLLQVFQRIVDAGHSVVVIEHNLDVIKCADWVIDLGPDAGERGGELVIAGTPEDVAGCVASHTGQFLRELLNQTSLGTGPVTNRLTHSTCV